MQPQPVNYHTFEEMLKRQGVQTNYAKLYAGEWEELLQRPLAVAVAYGSYGTPTSVVIEINGSPPKGYWFVRLDEWSPILWDGQLIPAQNAEGQQEPAHAAILQAVVELLRLVQGEEWIEKHQLKRPALARGQVN